MQDHMHRVNRMVLSLAGIWLKNQIATRNKCRIACRAPNSICQVWLEFDWNSVFHLETRTWAHVQSQTHIFEFDLSLTKSQQSIKKPMQEHMYKVKLIFEFDLSLTKIQYSTKKPMQEHIYKS